MPLNQFNQLLLVSFLIAWCGDQLFWQKTPGISMFLFILILLAGGIWLTWKSGSKPSRLSLLLVAPLLYFAGMSVFRLEPFTQLVNYLFTLVGLALLAVTWLGGQWLRYTLWDYALQFLRLAGDLLFGVLITRARSAETSAVEPDASEQSGSRRTSLNLLRKGGQVLLGLLIALPILGLLSALLSSADPVFERSLQDLFASFDLEKLSEYLFRLVLISIGGYLVAGAYLHSLLKSREEKLSAGDSFILQPFLGWVEASTILTSVNLLFGLFVIIQIRYFFGGSANIHIDGYTYSEYARRGFGELVAVTVVSLLLFLSLSWVTRRAGLWPRRIFSGLSVLLLALVAVMLVSAFQRLVLYETAYGFTRLRTYTHVFMVWLGLLLATAVLLEVAGWQKRFALAVVVIAVGFGASLNILNVDRFIVQANIARAVLGVGLDAAYLANLSDDAAPALWDRFLTGGLPEDVKAQAGAALACRLAVADAANAPHPWSSYHLSSAQAARLNQRYQAELVNFPARPPTSSQGWRVQVNGVWQTCESSDSMD